MKHMSYLPCELHCNSKNGEGKFTVGEILQRAENDHLALIGLTDKNTTDGWKVQHDISDQKLHKPHQTG